MTQLDMGRLTIGATVHVVRAFMLTDRVPHAARDIVAKGTVEAVLAPGAAGAFGMVRVRMADGWDNYHATDVFATQYEARTVARERLLTLAADLRGIADAID